MINWGKDKKIWAKKAEVETTRAHQHQPQLSGRAKDTGTWRTVMILVSNHTFMPPHRDPICIQPALPASTFSSLYPQQQHQAVRDSSLNHGMLLFIARTSRHFYAPVSFSRSAPFISSPSISLNPAARILEPLKSVFSLLLPLCRLELKPWTHLHLSSFREKKRGSFFCANFTTRCSTERTTFSYF